MFMLAFNPYITFQDMPHSEVIEQQILKKIEKLNTFYPRIMGIRTVVRCVQAHKRQGQIYTISLDITMPGKIELAVTRVRNQDLYVAIRDAFNRAERRIKKSAEKLRGEIKIHTPHLHGHITKLMPEGYG